MKQDLSKIQNKLGRGKSVIGLHIGTSSVNAVQVITHQGKLTLIKAVVEKITLKDGENLDSVVSAALRVVLSQFPIQRAAVICTIHDSQVFVRKITTPPMPVQELDAAVHLALKNAFPFSLDEAVLDFRLVGKFFHQDKEKYGVLVAACPIPTIERVRALFFGRSVKPVQGSFKKALVDKKEPKSAGVKLASFIPAVIALENLTGRFKIKADEIVSVIVFGSTVTEMIILKNSRLEFSRSLSVTGDEITKSMTGAFFSDTGKTELTFSEAEEVKKVCGIPKADDFSQITEKITSQQVLVLIGPKIEQLVTEINRSFGYYSEELQGGKVDRVLLLGEAAKLKRLDDFLSDGLGVEVRRANPLEGISLLDPSVISSQEESQKYVLSIGAALGSPQGINLLSQKPGKKNGRVLQLTISKIVVVLIVAVIGFYFVSLNTQIRVRSERIKKTKQDLISQVKDARAVLAIRRLSEGRPSWGEILKIFSNVPRNIYLTELSLSNDQLHIKGMVLIEGEDSKATLAQFISGLQEGVLKDARLKFSKKSKEEINQFEFEISANVETVE